MKKDMATNRKRAVCIMANELHRNGLNLSAAFRKAWRRVKQSMTIRAKGTTFENRQERLQFLKNFRRDDLTLSLHRDTGNRFDQNAVAIVVHIAPIKRHTVIGYVPRGLAGEMARLINKGVAVSANFLSVIGGYDYKESLGLLLNVTI